MSNKTDIRSNLFLSSIYDEEKDEITIITKDVDTREKRAKIIKNPKLRVYKYNKPTDIYQEFVLLRDTTCHHISYRWKEYDIARLLGVPMETFKESIKSGAMKARDILLNKYIFGADIDIRNQYLEDYMNKFPFTEGSDGYPVYDDVPPIRNLNKGYGDLEWDIAVSEEKNEQPIYMCTYIDEYHRIAYTYYLYNPEYNGIDELISNPESIIEKMKSDINESIDNIDIDDPEKKEKIQKILYEIADSMTYVTKVYFDEAEMLRDYYQLMYRQYKPDFLAFYNTVSDISQTRDRAEVLGIPDKDLFTCPEIGDSVLFDYSDKTFEPHKKKHYYDSQSYTKLIDYFIMYYTIRRTEMFSSRGLDDTAYREIGMRKISFSHICSHIRELPYKDFITTYMYNVRDVLLMAMLEGVLCDINKCLSTRFLQRTEYENSYTALMQVNYTFNSITRRKGKVSATNINKILAKLTPDQLEMYRIKDPLTYKLAMLIKSDKKIDGGYCTDPNKFKGEGMKEMLSFMPSLIIRGLIDEDAAAEYPNAIISGNMGKSSIYGRIIKISGEDINDKEVYEYTEAIVNRDIVNIGRSFFNLPDLKEILELLEGEVCKKAVVKSLLHMKLTTFMDSLPIDIDDIKKYSNRFTNIDKVLSSLFNPKLSNKDVEAGEVDIRGMYILSNMKDDSIAYNGTKVSYGLEVDKCQISMKDYLGFKQDVICVDSANKEIDNSLIDIIKPKETTLTYDYIGTYSMKDYIPYMNGKYNQKIKMKFGDCYIGMGARHLIPSNKLFTQVLVKDIKTLASLKDIVISPNSTIALRPSNSITVSSDINIFEMVDGAFTRVRDIPSDVENIAITFTNSKGKCKTITLRVMHINIDISKVNNTPEDFIYHANIRFNIPITNDTSLNIKQEFFFVNTTYRI